LLSEGFFDIFSEKFLASDETIESLFSRLSLKEVLLTSDFFQQAFVKINEKCNAIIQEKKLSTICSFYLDKYEFLDSKVKKTFISQILFNFKDKKIQNPIFSKNF